MIETIKNYLYKKFTKDRCEIQENSVNINEVINGSYNIHHIVVNRSLKINGEAILGKGVSIEKKMVVNGTVIATGVDFNAKLVVNGDANLTDSKINEQVFFRGVLQSTNSIFAAPIYLLISESYFDNCQIISLIIEKLPSEYIVQKIWLNNKTTVTGDVLFRFGIGELYIDESSVILGNVIGGTLIPL